MTTRRKSTDWTETLLYLGLFILFTTFLFQLLKLWNSNGKSLGGLFTSLIPDAVSNTLGAVENALTGGLSNAVAGGLQGGLAGVGAVLTAPFTFVFSLLGFIPTILSLFGSFISSIFSGTTDLTGLTAPVNVGGGLETVPSDSGYDQANGSSYPFTTQGNNLDSTGNAFSVTL